MSWIDGLLYPERCVHCGAPDLWLCRPCGDAVRLVSRPLPVPPLPSGRALAVGRVFACAPYAAKPWSSLVMAVKYENLRGLEYVLRPRFEAYRAGLGAAWPFGLGEGWTLVPVPTNPDHLAERGADHIDVWLAAFRALLPEARVATNVLRRRSGRVAHASLETSGAREAESEAAVAVQAAPPERVILVDDVYTTGATIQACARALRAAGAQEFEACVAAASFAPR